MKHFEHHWVTDKRDIKKTLFLFIDDQSLPLIHNMFGHFVTCILAGNDRVPFLIIVTPLNLGI